MGRERETEREEKKGQRHRNTLSQNSGWSNPEKASKITVCVWSLTVSENGNNGYINLRGVQGVRVAMGRDATVRDDVLRERGRSPMSTLFCEPLLAFLDVLIQQECHVADDECEHDLREELRSAPELCLGRHPVLSRESRIQRRDRLAADSLSMLIQYLGLIKKLCQSLNVDGRRIQATDFINETRCSRGKETRTSCHS